ncbi:hypothetical protein ACCT25_29390, partial [Rhizobium ruizarguesonis]
KADGCRKRPCGCGGNSPSHAAGAEFPLESDAKKRHALSDDVVLYAFDLDRNSDFRPILQKLPASGTPFGCRD